MKEEFLDSPQQLSTFDDSIQSQREVDFLQKQLEEGRKPTFFRKLLASVSFGGYVLLYYIRNDFSPSSLKALKTAPIALAGVLLRGVSPIDDIKSRIVDYFFFRIKKEKTLFLFWNETLNKVFVLE
jgi:hypothetical protein